MIGLGAAPPSRGLLGREDAENRYSNLAEAQAMGHISCGYTGDF